MTGAAAAARRVDLALVTFAITLVVAAAGAITYGLSEPDIAPPTPFGDRGAVRKKLPPARPVPRAPEGPRPALPARPDGLVVWDVVQGQGEPLSDDVLAVVEYTGFLPDGTVFDSTYERGGPTRIRTGGRRLLPGWEVGLPGLREGGVRQLVVPPALSFGPRGLPGRVPPGSTVTYDFALLELIALPEAPTAVPEDAYVDRSGIRAHDLVVGDGAPLDDGQRAIVDYIVWAPDGGVVDTSYDRPAPFSFSYGDGALAWEAGLTGMSVGGRRQLVIPPEQAFGAQGRPPLVPPDATIVVEVELRGVE